MSIPIPVHLPSTRPRFLLRRHRWLGAKEEEGNTPTEFREPSWWPAGHWKRIHTKAVREALASSGSNGVLGSAAPDVDAEEVEPPKGTRTTLAQLRSGYCSALSTFKHRIGISPAPTCPCCRQADYTTQHLFSCTEHSTELSPLDLWRRPRETVAFLQTWPCFERMRQERPPPEPPPTQRRRERGLWWWWWGCVTVWC